MRQHAAVLLGLTLIGSLTALHNASLVQLLSRWSYGVYDDAATGFYLFAAAHIARVERRLVALGVFSLVLLAAQKDIGRLGDALNVALFLLGLWLVHRYSLPDAGRRRTVWLPIALVYLLLATINRFDLALLIAAIIVLYGFRTRRLDLIVAGVSGMIFSTFVYVGIVVHLRRAVSLYRG